MSAIICNPLLPVVSCRSTPPSATPASNTRLLPPLRSPPCLRGSSRAAAGTAPRAKFGKFDDQEGPAAADDDGEGAEPSPGAASEEEEEEDSDLPGDLVDAIRQSGRAAALFVSSGGMRAIVELLIPQLQFLDSEGAQEELWGLSRIFLDTLIQETGGAQRVKAIFPDTGAAALLQYQWKDADFGFSSLSDRKPVENGDGIVVMIVPDYQMLEYVEQIASRLSDDPPRPLIMWNPRLISEDVGVGFNVRKLRRYFLSTFTTVYSMKPLPSGAIFRCYPGMWKVFYDDKDRPNRYRLAKEQASRPDATEIEQIFGDVEEKTEEGPSIFLKAMGMFSSLNRFMKAISK
uniref:Ras-related protein Rab-41 n=1 Tax=Anthurium amnicola TaxID=1678845 RepID=A0A1D1Y5R5_9ARAE